MAKNVQDHVHLSTTLTGSPEFAPDMKWTVKDRDENIIFRAEIVDSLTGNIYAHVIQKDGIPVVRSDYQYTIKIIGDNDHNTFYYESLLNSLAGKYVYMVDNYHEDDGEDHTDSIIQAFVSQIGPYPVDHYMLQFFYVPIYLNNMTQP
jgi:hypothetical protein